MGLPTSVYQSRRWYFPDVLVLRMRRVGTGVLLGTYCCRAAQAWMGTEFRIVRPVKSWRQDQAGQSRLMSMTGPD